ncbi:MAG: HNH endonuclease, partial [Deltaproteobacteria bacterium]
PEWLPALKITLGLKVMPQSWRDYLYWNIELEE